MSNQEKVPPAGWLLVKSRTRPDKYYYYNKQKKISVWKLSECDEIDNMKNFHPKTPKKSPKKEPKISPTSLKIGKRNLANDRLKKLQTSFKEEAKHTKIEKKYCKPNSTSVQTSIISDMDNVSKASDSSITQSNQERNGDESMDIDEQLDKSTDSLKDYESMDWEYVVEEVHSIRTIENIEASYFADNRVGISQNNFYIILDTNVLISNLEFVKQIKSKHFKDIGKAYIYLPYIVLCELDRLKMRDEIISRSARIAITFIDKCFKENDEFLLGQNAIDSSKKLISNDSGDDYILNCCLQLKQSTMKILLLSNDKNLRNKAFVNEIAALSPDDYNASNSIQFK